MKRIFLLVVAVVCAVFAVACVSNVDIVRDIENNLGELRQNAYHFEDDELKIDIITGKREEPYSLDGVANSLIEFCVITFTPKNGDLLDYDFVLTSGENEYTGMLDPHPFNAQYIQDTGAMVEGNLVITIGSSEGEITRELMPLCTADMIGYRTAIDSFARNCEADVRKLYSGKTLMAEAYVRFIIDPFEDSGVYYWYVAVTNGADTYAVLIDTLSGEVVAKR